jgi:hydrogenase expression/formation protein HypE
MSCPFPTSDYPVITMAHGGGGRLTSLLIDSIFRPIFASAATDFHDAQHDSARLQIGNSKLAFTTDSYVVSPLFFPGGDIGTLAVTGTVNDLAMSGARPLYLSCGFILEEGLKTDLLVQIVQSMQRAASISGVQLVTGDTKVVEKGKGDGIFVNTAGIGVIEHDLKIEPASIRPGDSIVLSGDVGRHGTAILSAREGLQFESTIQSDCAPLYPMVAALLKNDIELHCLRDLTRGGLATALAELATVSRLSISFKEHQVPVCGEVRGACEVLGLDPLYCANEGRMIAFVPEAQAHRALAIVQSFCAGSQATLLGNVTSNDGKNGRVVMTSRFGTERFIDRLSGEQLPRIC